MDEDVAGVYGYAGTPTSIQSGNAVCGHAAPAATVGAAHARRGDAGEAAELHREADVVLPLRPPVLRLQVPRVQGLARMGTLVLYDRPVRSSSVPLPGFDLRCERV